jgi:exopolysaccharide production protein ExoQ
MGLHLPPTVALVLTIAFIVFLFRRDIRERPKVTGALWLPLIWFLIICSRQPSEWLNIFGFHLGAVSLEEGSPLDACIYFGLIAAGTYVLRKRNIRISEIVRDNQWLTIFFVYCFLAIFWSDFPFVAFKRWIKILGHPVMVLILLTEPDLKEALVTSMKRCAYVIVPVSILFIKYYPELGREFDAWEGQASNNGITTGKNALGADCLILGFFFFWYLVQIWGLERNKKRRNELFLTSGFLIAIWWLFSMAHSSTSLVSCVIGISVVVFVGLRFVNPRLIGTYLVCAGVLFIFAQTMFDVWGQFLQFLGKNETLTDRTEVWHDALQIQINPFLGAGFESFWLGDRLKIMWAKWTFQPNQAHNGYLETYLNLGLVGLFLLIGLFVATFRKCRQELLTNFQFGRFRLGFLVAIIAYNWTEAAFKNISPLWFVFYIIALDCQERQFAVPDQLLTTKSAEAAEELLAPSWNRQLAAGN